MPYVASPDDMLTLWLRACSWQPTMDLRCGCTPAELCEQHAWQRAGEDWERWGGASCLDGCHDNG